MGDDRLQGVERNSGEQIGLLDSTRITLDLNLGASTGPSLDNKARNVEPEKGDEGNELILASLVQQCHGTDIDCRSNDREEVERKDEVVGADLLLVLEVIQWNGRDLEI